MRTFLLVAALAAALPAEAKPPKLAVVISVDAFGSDVYLRTRARMKAGLATFAKDGAVFPVAHFEYAEAATAAGHATLATGANPWRHGVVSNRVINRTTGKTESIFVDPGHPVLEVPLGAEDSAPVSLLAETLGDRLLLSTGGKAKVVAVSGKARAAIALAGKLGQAWWFHEGVGKFVTGTYYRKEFPTWVKGFNDKRPADGWMGKTWALQAPKGDYTGADDRPFESDWYGMGRTFPHPLSGGLSTPGPQAWSALASSPFLMELEVQFAKAAIDGEGLGKDDVPDLLWVSLSSFDRIFHLYGPYSWELQDAVLRLDRVVADLIAAAEKAAGGRGNVVVALTADHGGAAVPEEWAALGLEGVRVNPVVLEKGLEKELQARFNAGDLVLGIEETDVYLDLKAIADKKLDPVTVRRAAAAWLRAQPDLAWAVARDDLAVDDPLATGVQESLRKGFHPDRSGDVLLVTKPYHVMENEPAGTGHGSPWAYDSDVPFLLLGKGVKAGYYGSPIRAVDMAPTLGQLLDVGAPASAEGGARGEALAAPR